MSILTCKGTNYFDDTDLIVIVDLVHSKTTVFFNVYIFTEKKTAELWFATQV